MNRKSARAPSLECGKVSLTGEASEQDAIDLKLAPGEVLGVVGPSHSGKSELMAAMAGLAPTPSGQLKVCGWKVGPRTRRLVGYVSRTPGVYEELTCEEYLDFFAEAFEVERHFRPYLVREAMRTVRLEGYQDKVVRTLGFGLRRWLGLARALIHDPEVLVMDDCLRRLERSERNQLLEILTDVRNQGRTLVLGSDSLSELAGLCSHVCVLVSRRALACGSVKELLPTLSNLRMMQVQFEAGFRTAVRFLERHEKVFHLAVSTRTGNLVRFLFEGKPEEFSSLLKQLQAEGCSIVSYAEDQDFLGKAR